MHFRYFVNLLIPVAIAGLGYFGFQHPKTQSIALFPKSQSEVKFNNDGSKNLPEFTVVDNSIHDGDTIRARSQDGQILKVRFACIDAPELKQPGGIEARDYLKKLLSEGNNKVKLRIVDTDRYGRSVAEVWNSKGLVQAQEAIAGKVYAYDQYKDNCPNFNEVKSAEKKAIDMKLGIWKNPDAQRPWDYRKSTKQ